MTRKRREKKENKSQKFIIFWFNLTQLQIKTKRLRDGSDAAVCGWPGLCWRRVREQTLPPPSLHSVTLPPLQLKADFAHE